MKTNKMMRIASVMLVAVILSTCAISGTFAKYVTSTTGTDNARVAYWGFDQGATLTIEMFADTYDSENVKSSNSDNVVAPGTSKTTTFSFGYTPKGSETNALTAGEITAPEVAYTFVVNPTITGDYDALNANKNFVWTLQASGESTAKEYQTVDEFLAAIKALSGDAFGTKVYTAGTLPTAFTAADQEHTIGWKWNFHENADGDTADTAMGNAQDLDDVTFTITISATQIN